jgi:hypothetical protein
MIPVGQFSFPFSLVMPKNTPYSCLGIAPLVKKNGIKVRISYKIKARAIHLDPSQLPAKGRRIVVKLPPQITGTAAITETTTDTKIGTCFMRGSPITVQVNIPSNVFVQGEPFVVNGTVDNSKGGNMTAVRVSIETCYVVKIDGKF